MEQKKRGRPKLLDSEGKPLYPDPATKLRIWRKRKKAEERAKQNELMKERLKPYTIQKSEKELQLENVSKFIKEENKIKKENVDITDKSETLFTYLNRMIKNGYNIRYSREQGSTPNRGIVNELTVVINDINKMSFDLFKVSSNEVKQAIDKKLFT